MEIPKIPDGEYRFADLVWENEPINSTALIKTAQERLGWKKDGLPRPGALVLCYPVVTMEEPLTHTGSRQRLLGPDPDPALAAAVSVERQVTADYPPVFLWWGEADAAVDPANSRMLLAALEAAGVRCEHASYPGVGHGVGLGEGLACAGWPQRAVDFWRSVTG